MTLYTRIFNAVLFSGLIGFYFYRAWGLEHGNDFSARDRLFGLDRRDKVIHIGFYPLILPLGLAVIFAILVIKDGWPKAPALFFRLSADLLLTMSFYYVALLLLMPLLRRYISARACASAWLLPALLYYVSYSFTMTAPRIVLYVPKRFMELFLPVWLGGFALIFGLAVLSHVRFRHRILAGASDECDETVLAIFRQESEQLGFKTPIRLVRSGLAKTPFSMGDSRRTRVTVLPVCSYTEKELRLIFRHELHHIQRNDADSKLFFVFLCALFWFHPLVWLAFREAGRDLELSCDEIVLDSSDENERRFYADLLLKQVGERRGFTTCLSADASALRYRLRHIMHKRPRRTGTVFLMVLLFTCLMCHGVFAISDGRLMLGDTFSVEASDYFLYEAGDGLCRSDTELTDTGRETLVSYLQTLPVEHLSGSRFAVAEAGTPRLYLSDSRTKQSIWLCDGSVIIYDLEHIDYRHAVVYFIRADIDWEKIGACFGVTGS